MKSLTQISKLIALVLRHKPEELNLRLDEHGWASVPELIASINEIQPFNMEMLEKIVAEDSKQRYAFSEDKLRIRANQGHSIPVDVELEEAVPPALLWHGTGEKYVGSILESGLIHKNRLYVHLSREVETALAVGKRHGKPVLFAIDARSMVQDGHRFYLSRNGVWLVEAVPVEYLIQMPPLSSAEEMLAWAAQLEGTI